MSENEAVLVYIWSWQVPVCFFRSLFLVDPIISSDWAELASFHEKSGLKQIIILTLFFISSSTAEEDIVTPFGTLPGELVVLGIDLTPLYSLQLTSTYAGEIPIDFSWIIQNYNDNSMQLANNHINLDTLSQLYAGISANLDLYAFGGNADWATQALNLLSYFPAALSLTSMHNDMPTISESSGELHAQNSTVSAESYQSELEPTISAQITTSSLNFQGGGNVAQVLTNGVTIMLTSVHSEDGTPLVQVNLQGFNSNVSHTYFIASISAISQELELNFKKLEMLLEEIQKELADAKKPTDKRARDLQRLIEKARLAVYANAPKTMVPVLDLVNIVTVVTKSEFQQMF